MKAFIKLSAIISMFLLGIQANSQSPVSLHHAGSVTMFYNSAGFTDAYNASVAGDTIYLPGGFFTGLTINKKLAIFGAGHHPDSSANTYPTQINGSLTFGPDADSSHIEGLHVTGNVNVSTANNKIDRLRIRRNIIDGTLSLHGDRVTPSMHVEISGNIVRSSVDLSNTLGVVLCNNILQSRIHYIFQGSVSNNVFTSSPYWSDPYYVYTNLYDIDNSKIENNIFVHQPGTLTFLLCDNSVINKNLFSTASVNYTNNMATGNFTGVGSANVLVNWTSSSYLYTDNYHLKAPESYIGMDGTQMGIYGGLRPWKEGSLPLNPHIQSKIIVDKTDAAGKIQVQVKVVAQNN
jgi:hypothetical protein